MARNDVLATTWSRDESGLLWERLWIRDDTGYCTKLIAGGVFTPPTRYEDEAAFWVAFEDEKARFGGRRGDG